MKKLDKQNAIIEMYEGKATDPKEREMLHRAKITSLYINMRVSKKLSQTDVAKRMGITFQQIAKFESMSNSPTLSFLVKYAMALGADIDFALNEIAKAE